MAIRTNQYGVELVELYSNDDEYKLLCRCPECNGIFTIKADTAEPEEFDSVKRCHRCQKRLDAKAHLRVKHPEPYYKHLKPKQSQQKEKQC